MLFVKELTRYTFNALDMPVSANINGAETAYTYDGNNLRTSKTVNGTTTEFLYDGTDIIGEKTGAELKTYVRGDKLLSDSDGKYYHYDTHGSVSALTNAQNEVLAQNAYDAYGAGSVSPLSPFGYCGEYTDSETGFVYLRNRYYDTQTGRFISEDPIKDGDNWYAYCDSNPVNKIDPSGLYDRKKVKEYIKEWWNGRNKEYYSYRTDCANFVSQCLYAGEIEMKNNWHSYKEDEIEGFNIKGLLHNNYKYEWNVSESWRLAEEQFKYFSNPYHGFIDGEVLQLWSEKGMKYNIKNNNIQIGDLMYFADKSDRKIYHATIISKIENGKIYFAGHTSERFERELTPYLKDKMVFIIRIRDDAKKGYIE